MNYDDFNAYCSDGNSFYSVDSCYDSEPDYAVRETLVYDASQNN